MSAKHLVGERQGASEGGELSIRGIDQAVTHHTGHDTPTRGLGPLARCLPPF